MSVSTHVLDTGTGRPAGGMVVRLYEGEELLAEGRTDGDGRCRLAEGATGAGQHRLVFATGPWFATQHRETFFPVVSITFAVLEPDEHHHVPLLLSPFAYSTYRGS